RPTVARPSHTSCAFHSAPTVGSAWVAEAMASTPRKARASAATSVGKSKLSGSGRSAKDRLRARLQLPWLGRRVLLGKPVLEEHLEHLAHDGGGGGAAVPAVLHHH